MLKKLIACIFLLSLVSLSACNEEEAANQESNSDANAGAEPVPCEPTTEAGAEAEEMLPRAGGRRNRAQSRELGRFCDHCT